MAEIGRRQEVNDPLAMNPLRRDTERSLPTYGVRNPGITGGDAATRQGLSALNAIDGLQAVAGRIFAQAAETGITEGKLAYMQGATEQDIAARGDKYQTRGWQAMSSVNTANEWFIGEAQFIQDQGAQMNPDEYRARLMESRKQAMANMPKDDAQARELWAAAFDDSGPRLMAMQVEQHNKYNEARASSEFTNALMTGTGTYTDASVPSNGFRVSQEQVRTPLLNQSTDDRDYGIRTLLGEAAGEGQQGMAAVAHVIMNRMGSKRFGYGSVKEAVLAEKQFSAWNSGAGGNDPTRWDTNSAQYKRAAAVWDAVTQGHHVDPTGGATHYYSPKGMKGGAAPDWWNEEAKNGQIKVGNHLFASAGRPGNGPKGTLVEAGESNPLGQLAFKNKGQSNLEGNFRSILEETAGEFGGTLTINSGYRSPGHNAAVGGAKNSRHMHGDAADISMAGMSERERSQLVDSLRAKGVKGFITYKNSPDMLHVDMLDRTGDGKAYYMFDKSKDNLGKAPHWFQEMAMTDEGGTATPRRGSQVQAFIDAAPLKPAAKSAALADAMRRSLDSGDDSLFNDAGGVSYLYGLGATPSDIDSVLKAKERFDNNKDKEFDLGRERARADLLARVSSGEFGSMDDVDAAVADLIEKENLSDGEARSLYRQVASDMGKAGDNVIPIEMRSMLNQKLEEVAGGATTPEEAAAELEAYGKANGIKASVVNNMAASVFSKAASEKEKLRTEARTEQKKVEAETRVRQQAEAALTTGSGLRGLGGQHRIPDDLVPGGVKEVSGEKYGVWALKKSAADAAQRYVMENGQGANQQSLERLQSEAEVQYNKTVYENLRKQGVYDTEFGDQMSATVVAGVIDPETKQISEGAMRAFDTYMQLASNPKVGEEYVSGMIRDDKARSFFETARKLYDGRQDIGQALMAASNVLNAELRPEQRIQRNTEFNIKSGTEITKAVRDMIRPESWLDTSKWRQEDRDMLGRNTDMLQSYVFRQAQTYNLTNPNEPTEVSIKKAVQDLQRNSVVVGSDVIVGNEQNGTRLDQVMGLDRLGRQAPHQAVQQYIEEVMVNSKDWKDLWDAREGSSVTGVGGLGDLGGGGNFKQKRANFQTWFNPLDGSLQITMWKDATRTEQVGRYKYVPAKDVGEWYKSKVSAGEPNVLQRMWRGIVDTSADVGQADGSNAFARGVAASGGIDLN